MTNFLRLSFLVTIASLFLAAAPVKKKKWISLFDGKTLNGWKVGANAETFKVEDGAIAVNGKVAHLFYNGEAAAHNFKNFELKLDIMTMPGSNSGVYIHTDYQDAGWPKKGYEVQVNNSHTDWRRTAGLYAVQDVKEAPAKDNEWFTMHITVKDKHIKVSVNNKTVADYTEPENAVRDKGMEGRLLSSGTIALQGHDPKSKVLYKNIMLKILK
ncbi:MAG: 3-keto-disaccharide hydrolase [Lacibacter sp.]